jgi:hypothetical protein
VAFVSEGSKEEAEVTLPPFDEEEQHVSEGLTEQYVFKLETSE